MDRNQRPDPHGNRPIIYALGRLFTRQFSPTPTGIDRLDLRYAEWLLRQRRDGRPVFFVRQVCDVMRLVGEQQAEQLIDELWQKWVLNKPVQVDYRLRRIEVEGFWLRNKCRSLIKPSLDPKLIKAVQGLGRPYYLNAAHIGAQFAEVHRLLRERLGAELVFYLHDIIPIDYPEYFSNRQGDKIHRGRVQVMAEQGSLVLVNSLHTANRFAALCAKEGWRQPPTQVLYIGVEDHIIEASKQPPRPLPDYLRHQLGDTPYFVVVGTIEPRKNHLLLLHIWRKMAQECQESGASCPKLLIIGRRGWENENIIDLLERCHWIKPHVIEVNGLSDPELIAAIQHAKALLMPSWEEGWGIPVAEALTLGTPVICSEIPALRECGQGLAHYIEAIDGAGWSASIYSAKRLNYSKLNYSPMVWSKHLESLGNLIIA